MEQTVEWYAHVHGERGVLSKMNSCKIFKRLLAFAILLVMMLSVYPASAEFGFSFMPTKEYKGVTYEARPTAELTTVLLIGYDHKDYGDLTVEQHGYSKGGQSDFMLLLVFDHEAKQIRRLQFDRDTITPIKLINTSGVYVGAYDYQLCLSHAYGATQEVNNANAIWAVENLLGIADSNDGAGVDWYMTMDISGINKLNELLGGVTVPIYDDFSFYDKTMVKGTTMRLTGEQAEYYCRYRYYIGEQSNKSRMARQRVFMDSAAALLKGRLGEDINFANELLNGMGIVFDSSTNLENDYGFSNYKGTPVTDTPDHYLMTNESISGIVDLLARVINYDLQDTETFPGAHSINDKGFMEYHLEDDVATDWAISVFYNPVK